MEGRFFFESRTWGELDENWREGDVKVLEGGL